MSIALMVLSATMGSATHNFSDVPNSPASIHDAVDWGVDRGLISGCGSGKFCPNSSLTRGQAMLIMKRLADVVSPQTLQAEVFEVTNQDLDPAPVVCQTSTLNKGYTEWAFGIGRTSLAPDINNLKFDAKVVYQRNGGSWLPFSGKVTPSQSASTDEDIENVNFGVIPLDAGATYKFGIKIELIGHTPSPAIDSNYECALMVHVFNRN